jgi:hypothetical protein
LADVKISQLPAASTPLAGTEQIPLVQDSTTKQITVSNLLTSANLGTPSAINLANATNVPMDEAAGVLAVANGGTGTATPALVAGTNVTISGSWPNQTINSTYSGAVTSVTGTAPVVSSGGTTPAISMAAATGSVNGYLTSTDWTTFNNKLTSGGALGTPSSGTATNLTGLPLSTGVTGLLPVANGGTGTATPALVAGSNVTISGTWPNQTIAASGAAQVYPGAGIANSTGSAWGTSYSTTGSGTVLALATSPTFVTPALGTPASGDFSTGTFTWPTFNQNTSGTAAGLSTTLAVASGGTGQTSYTDGQLLIGNSTGNTLTKATLTAGANITITNSAGGITIAATGGGGSGTVTSVSGAGTVNGLTLTGTVTTSGSLTLGGTLDLSSPPAIGGTTAAAITGTVVTATTKVVTPYVDAVGSGGGQLRNASGTSQLAWGAGGGSNLTLEVATNINPANAAVSIAPTGTGTVTINPATAGTINNMSIGATTPTTGAFTTVAASGAVTLSGGTANGVTYLNGSKVLTSGSALTFDGTNLATTNNVNVPNTFGFKNRIINGDMRIDQRNAGASVVVGSGVFPIDRWFAVEDTDGALTAEQVEDVPAGFVNSTKITTTTADTNLTTTQTAQFMQNIEGFNVSDLGFGSASAQTVTLSFWVKSSLTGTMGGSVRNDSANRSYPFSYTISVANTWEQKSITIAGDTTGTWLTDNSIGIRLVFSLGCGPSRLGTAGAWNANNNTGPTGEVSVIGTLNATWYITGVQLEKGSTATSFDVRPYATEFNLCQRYYWSKALETSYSSIASGAMITTSIARMNVVYPTKMRTSPTITTSNIGNSIIATGLDINPSGTFTAYANTTSVMMDIDTPATGTVGRGAVWIFGATATTLAASAEL